MKWRETPMHRFARCPIHGCLAVMRWTLKGWRWSWGCTDCLEDAATAQDRLS